MKYTHSKNIRYLSALMLIIFIIGTLASLSLLPSFAVSPFSPEAMLMKDEDRINLYLDPSNVFESKEAKLATMSARTVVGDYQLFVDTTTGEVAVKNLKTGQILATNPYDVASAPDAIKAELMNQLNLTFCNVKDNKQTVFGTFTQAALRRQIEVKNIKSGLRVEYTLGKEASNQLVPGWVEYNRFVEFIRDPVWNNCYTLEDYERDTAQNSSIKESYEELRTAKYNYLISGNYQVIDPYMQVNNTYVCLGDPDTVEPAKSEVARLEGKYKCITEKGPSDYNGDGEVDKMAIVVIRDDITEREKSLVETAVKQYTAYTYELLQEDTAMTGYESKDSNPALFRLALEYTLTEDGLEVRLPANSIRFDEDTYRLISIDVLPYFGTTSNDYTGYTFIPDGSGTIIRNEEIMNDGKNQFSVRGQIYGPDFAYHKITTYYNGKDQLMRLPVFGAIEDTVMVTDNLNNRVGYIWAENTLTNSDGTTVYYTKEDRIMIDSVDSKGNLFTTVEDFLAQFKVNEATGEVSRYGDSNWNNADFVGTIKVGDGDDPLSEYKKYLPATPAEGQPYETKGKVPYAEVVMHYLMAPVLDETGKVITYKGKTVYQYVDAAGEPLDLIIQEAKDENGNLIYETDENDKEIVDANGNKVVKLEFFKKDGTQYLSDPRTVGEIKIREQLWFKGQPAYYDSDIPLDPSLNVPDAPVTEAPVETDENGDPIETTAETTEAPEETLPEDTDETTEEIPSYNEIPKVEEKYDTPAYEEIESEISQGYFAIITEGDALCNITSRHGGKNPTLETGGGTDKYNSVYITVFPRPQDSYRLADAISVSNDATEWVVVSDRKYTGSYRIKYVMLSEASYEDENGQLKPFENKADYVGMAKVYRDYLIKNGTLNALTNLDDDIPLFLEAFGMTNTTKVIATIPMVVDVALTSFEDVKTIYDQLAGEGVDNINFRLTGFSKGGLYSYAPSAMKFESVVGGNGDYEDLIAYAKEISKKADQNLKIFPDFDFANVERVGVLDGFDSLKDSARTIDDRYASKREYDSTYQTFAPVGSITVSPSVFMRLYESFAKKIDKLGVDGLSVGSLGADLNSDFDTDDSYNREDSKYYTVQLLKTLKEKYGDIMIDGGNAFALPYADYILNMPLDSTRFARASTAVPFMGMLLHGYKYYAGSATGMASDINREMLKIIENGAAPYFTIAYQNTSALKDDPNFNDYYSIDYTICYDTILAKYAILNEALSDVQDATISGHTFLEAIRSLSAIEQAEVEHLMVLASSEENYNEARAAAIKAFNNGYELLKRSIIASLEKELAKDLEKEFVKSNPSATKAEISAYVNAQIEAEFNARYVNTESADYIAENQIALYGTFEEAYPHFVKEYTSEEDTKLYQQFIYDEYAASINRTVAGNKVVMVEYTRKDGTTKTFILNYEMNEVTVTYNGTDYVIASNGFAVAGK